VGNALQFFGSVDKHLQISAGQGLIEISQEPLEAIEVWLVGVLDKNQIDVTSLGLTPNRNRAKQNRLLYPVLLKNRPTPAAPPALV
jgi:hypothetical protein